MCGIFGLVVPRQRKIPFVRIGDALRELFIFSESRGKESAGIHVCLPEAGKSWTLKTALPASEFIESEEYKNLLREIFFEAEEKQSSVSIIAHSRLVTNGKAEDSKNNQPVCYDGIAIVHNGIIVNVDDLWKKNKDLERRAEVDTEVAAAILSRAYVNKKHPIAATSELFLEIKGSASIAWVNNNSDFLILASNTGDLFYNKDIENGFLSFASEKYILEQALNTALDTQTKNIDWVQPKTGLFVATADMETEEFFYHPVGGKATVQDLIQPEKDPALMLRIPQDDVNFAIKSNNFDEGLLRYNPKNLAALKRCSCCVLPETFPFIEFDEKGVCNYCRGYKPKYKNLDAKKAKQDFIESLQKYRGDGKNPDVIVPFSGGRDSCYGLHLIKKEFGLNTISFTYDWGMVTDLARRNIARLCGELGVQNILVSADIKTKRENIRKNVAAWLKKPDLGMVPLFMAGDKHFFSVVNQLKKQTGIKLDLWCANPLENTDFKSGFCGIKPDFDKSRLDYLSLSRKLQMIGFFGKQFLSNPSYLNSSLFDSFTSFFAYYLEPRRDFYFIFNHIVWNEDEVNKTIIEQYDFELSPDSPSSWRIGDGTAPFYNYIYVTTCGFSEFDTFRSNQIREGVISRDFAMERILEENKPRAESLRWYLDTINIDYDAAIRRINELDILGLHI